MTASVANNRPQRKLLSEELDRLDSIIDSLAEGLPEAIAQAAREGTRQAVKDAIVEVISNPELRVLFQSTPSTVTPISVPSDPVPPRTSLWSRIKAGVVAVKLAAVERVQAAKTIVAETYKSLAMVLPIKRILIVTAAVGTVAAATGYLAPAGVAAAISGLGGALTAAVAQIGNRFRRSVLTLLTTG